MKAEEVNKKILRFIEDYFTNFRYSSRKLRKELIENGKLRFTPYALLHDGVQKIIDEHTREVAEAQRESTENRITEIIERVFKNNGVDDAIRELGEYVGKWNTPLITDTEERRKG